LTGRSDARAEDGVAWLRALVEELQIPPLRTYGLGEADIDTLIDQASRASSMKANPIALTEGELRGVIVQVLGF
jgi:alcohol dehydrogenase class IV